MKITQHAQDRMKQRIISKTMISLVWQFGDPHGATDKFILSRPKIRELHAACLEIIHELNHI